MVHSVATSKLEIPYVDLAGQHQLLKEELMESVGNVFDHGQFIFGQEVETLEQQFAELCGVKYAVAVNSGTDALILALRVLGIGEGDEVITVPNSFIASTSCIILVGAQPVFVDVLEDYNLDTAKLEKAITPKTKAILPVHFTGRPANMAPIMELAKKHGLFVIEDCAQAVLAEYQGQRVGSIGEIGCFSLHPLKNLNGCGDGGMMTTDDENLARELSVLRNHGLKTRDECVTWSINSRLDTIQAAILLVKLKYLDTWTERCREIAAFYQQNLMGVGDLKIPTDQEYEKAVYHTFVVQTDKRDELKQYLADNGVGTAIHYPTPIHLQPAAAHLGHGPGSFPVAESLADRILSLPIYPELEQASLDYIVNSIKGFYQT